MKYPEKIEHVRRRLADWREEHGDEFPYVFSGCGYETQDGFFEEIMTSEEERNIVHYLEKIGELKIIKETKTGARIKALPEIKPAIKLKTLELISRELASMYIGTEIVSLLEDAKVPKELIIYPETKWKVFYIALCELAHSNREDDLKIILKIICEAVHPLNLGGDVEKSKSLVTKFNEYLKYDDYKIGQTYDEKSFYIRKKSEEASFDHILEGYAEDSQREFEEQKAMELSMLRTPKMLEAISVLKKTYQTLMSLVEVFCENPAKPTSELNAAYLKLKDAVDRKVTDLGLLGEYSEFMIYSFDRHEAKKYNIPFSNLFSAEKEFKEKNKKLNWDTVRPDMFAMYGEIEDLYKAADGSSTSDESDIQAALDGASSLVSETKKQNEKTKQVVKDNASEKIMRMEITGMPDLRVKNIDDGIITKGSKKRVTLPKFPRTEWSAVSVKFLSERDILLSDSKDTKQTSFEGMGCEDGRSGKPDESWDFLLKVALGTGETAPVSKSERKKQVKQKQKITDILRKIFKNDTDPFFTLKEGIYKAKFHVEYLNKPSEEVVAQAKDKYGDLGEAHSEMTKSSQENIESEFS